MIKASRRWLYDVLVESSLSLVEGVDVLEHTHPERDAEIYIRKPIDPEAGNQLSFQVIVSADEVEAAEVVADEELDKFLRMLSFVSSSPFKLLRKNFIIDWSPGLTEREVKIFRFHSDVDTVNALSADLINTLRMLQSWGVSKVLERAIRWFGSGVRANFLEDQFQFFFFSIEIIATNSKKTAEVADKCQRCGTELYCSCCNKVSTHKPFGSQVIELALERVGLSEADRKLMLKARNLLMHGSDRFEVEEGIKKIEPSATFHGLVDQLGRAAWVMILQAFQIPAGKHRPEFLQCSTFVDWQITLGAGLIVSIGGDPEAPRYEDIKLPNVSMELIDPANEA